MQIIKDSNNVILSGSVIIEGIEHLVQSKLVKCSSGLNHRSWNTTEKVSRCEKCFPLSNVGQQLSLF